MTADDWRKLGNSPGLWIFLFSSMGLLTLSLGEQKIQQRMSRQYRQSQQWIEAGQDLSQRRLPEDSASNPAGLDLPEPRLPAYIYEMDGLRWILLLAAVSGLILLVGTALTHRTDPNSSVD